VLGVGAPSSTLSGLGPARELATPASPSGAAVGARGLKPPREPVTRPAVSRGHVARLSSQRSGGVGPLG